MYNCKIHGNLKTEWCDKCKKICKCNCFDLVISRYKDLILSCEKGEITFTIYVTYCNVILVEKYLQLKRKNKGRYYENYD